jgi:hypothetical protein
MPYSVFAGDTLIGYSDLEVGDPPMGVASGKLRPTQSYATLRGECISALASGKWDRLHLSVRSGDGNSLPAQLGIMILDAYEIDPAEVEVHVAGIPYPLYEQLFPKHVEVYRDRKY